MAALTANTTNAVKAEANSKPQQRLPIEYFSKVAIITKEAAILDERTAFIRKVTKNS
ncbi:MAG: hypothetical protein LIP09_10895 [Bacteroidales bacterium]|nr:hypothetical protein [Bacteroidales bacterium]